LKYQILGKTGLRVSEISLGTMTFGKSWDEFNGTSKNTAKKIFDYYVDVGGNFFDTADIYQNGESEKYLGEFVNSDRESFVISSKYSTLTNPKNPNSGGNHRKNLFSSVESSLKRLNTTYLDLLWVHAWDFTTPISEVMRSLDDLVKQGKVHHIGISNAPAWIIALANSLSESKGWTSFSCIQILYNLLERSSERELLPFASYENLGVLAWSPLSGGMLSGKYSAKSTNGRFSKNNPMKKSFLNKTNLKLSETISKLAADYGYSSAQISLKWLLECKNPSIIPILGATNLMQLKENLECLNIKLNEKQLQKIDQITAIDLGYPQEFLNHPHIQERIFGSDFNYDF